MARVSRGARPWTHAFSLGTPDSALLVQGPACRETVEGPFLPWMAPYLTLFMRLYSEEFLFQEDSSIPFPESFSESLYGTGWEKYGMLHYEGDRKFLRKALKNPASPRSSLCLYDNRVFFWGRQSPPFLSTITRMVEKFKRFLESPFRGFVFQLPLPSHRQRISCMFARCRSHHSTQYPDLDPLRPEVPDSKGPRTFFMVSDNRQVFFTIVFVYPGILLTEPFYN